MSSIDHRIVEMKFNSAQFEEGVRRTTDSLAQLENGLKLDNIASGVDEIGSKFSMLNVIGATALGKLTSSVVDFGSRMANSVIDPLITGGKKRAQNIELAKFQFEGLKMDVEQAMSDALYAVDGTAYGLDVAASAASQLGASGVKLGEDMRSSLRGISGLAAMTGSSYEDVSSIFTKVAGQGRVMADDMNRISARGVSGWAALSKHMKISEEDLRSLVSKGKVDFATFSDAMSETFGEHATKANETYTGALGNMNAALSRIGELFATIKFEGLRRKFNALTPVINAVKDTIGPLVDLFDFWTERSVSKFEPRMETLAEVVKKFEPPLTILKWAVINLIKAFDTFVKPIQAAFNAVFPLGNAVDSVVSIFNKFALWLDRVATGLQRNEEQQAKIQSAFEKFFGVLKIVGEILHTVGSIIWNTIKALSGLGKVILNLLSPVGTLISKLFGFEGGGLSDWLKSVREGFANFAEGGLAVAIDGLKNFTGSLSDLVSSGIDKWADGVSSAVSFITDKLKVATGWVREFFSSFKSEEEGESLWASITNGLSTAWEYIQPVLSKIKDGLASLKEWLGDILSQLGVGGVTKILSAGVFAYVGVQLGGLISRMKKFSLSGIFSGLFGGLDISGMLAPVTDTLKAMQTELKAKALVSIATAIAILAGSLLVLSLVDTERMGSSLMAMGVLISVVSAAMFGLSKLSTPRSSANLVLMAGSMILLSTAILILSVALKNLSSLNTKEIGRGLLALGGIMAIVVGAALLLGAFGNKIRGAGVQMMLLATAVLILSAAVKTFASMDLASLGKGIGAVAAVMAVLVLSVLALGKGSMKALPAAAAIMTISLALLLLSGVVKIFASMELEELYQGIGAVAASLLVLVVATKLMGKNALGMAAGAIAITAMAVALTLLIVPIMTLGSMPFETLAQGVGALAAALLVMGVAMKFMSSNLAGAASLTIMTVSLYLLAGVIALFGTMDLATVGKALLIIAGSILALAGVALLMAPAIPAMLALAGVIALLGLGLVLAAGSILLFSIGLAALSVSLLGASGALLALGKAAEKLVPYLLPLAGAGLALLIFGAGAVVAGIGAGILGVGIGILSIAFMALSLSLKMLSSVGTEQVQALTDILVGLSELVMYAPGIILLGAAIVILGAGMLALSVAILLLSVAMMTSENAVDDFLSLISGLVDMIPQLLESFAEGIVAFAGVISANAPTIVAAGIDLVQNFIQGVIETIPMVIEAAVTFVMEFLQGMQEVIPEVIATAVLLITEFLQGIQEVFPEVVDTAVLLITELLRGVRETVPDIVETAVFVVNELLQGLVSMTEDIVQAGFDMLMAILEGIENNIEEVVSKAADVVVEFVTALGKNSEKIVDAGFDAIIEFINGITKSIEKNSWRLQQAGRDMAWAVADGLTFGLASKVRPAASASLQLGGTVSKGAETSLGIRSPSRVMMRIGEYAGEGLIIGIESMADGVEEASEDVGHGSVDALRQSLLGIPDVLDDIDWDADPVISPVLDLSDIERNARDISNLLGGQSVNASINHGQAQGISSAEYDRMMAMSASTPGAESGGVTFVQNNNSPKALSTAEIYRQTRNQISTLRGGTNNVRGTKIN